MSQVVGLRINSYKSITNTAWVRAQLCKLQKGCTRLTAASDKVYQLLAHGRWFSPGTPASSTTKTGHHDIAEILLKVALKHQKRKKIKSESQNINYLFLWSLYTDLMSSLFPCQIVFKQKSISDKVIFKIYKENKHLLSNVLWTCDKPRFT